MKDLFGNEIDLDMSKDIPSRLIGRTKDGTYKSNPLIPIYGQGPEGTRCKHCKHLYRKSYAKNYYKCSFRKDTNSPTTDHRVNWDSCGKFEKNESK